MYYRKDNDCEKCNDCVNDPSKLYCDISCPDTTKNCRESL